MFLWKPRFIGSASLCVVACCASLRADEAHRLPPAGYKPGSTYKSRINVEVQPCDSKQKMRSSVSLETTVTKVAADGGAMQRVAASGEGQSHAYLVQRDALGQCLSVKAESGDGAGEGLNYLLWALREPVRNSHALIAGTSWNSTMLSPVDGKSRVTVTVKFLGYESASGKSLIKLEQWVKHIPLDPTHTLTDDSTFWLDPHSGQVLRMQMRLGQFIGAKHGDLMLVDEQRESGVKP